MTLGDLDPGTLFGLFANDQSNGCDEHICFVIANITDDRVVIFRRGKIQDINWHAAKENWFVLWAVKPDGERINEMV